MASADGAIFRIPENESKIKMLPLGGLAIQNGAETLQTYDEAI